jgi:ssDNA-binding Zn-finger/Zn-ribbon topoisomerase 1
VDEPRVIAPKCPYCGRTSRLSDSAEVYQGRSFGKLWLCRNYPDCDAYVGVHRGTERPLGRLANKELRRAKKAAHDCFDQLWRYKVERGSTHRDARNAGYRWLSEKLGLPPAECHIGMMDVRECERIVKLCAPYLRREQ